MLQFDLEYLAILLTVLLVTVLLEKKFCIHLYKNRKEWLVIVSIFFIIGVIWDSFAIWRGHWIFPKGKNLGISIGLMPLEEYLFMIIVPYLVLTIYKIIDAHFKSK